MTDMNSSLIQFSPSALAAAREAAGMTLSDTAERIGRSVGTIGGWETGKSVPRVDDAVAMATAYNVPVTAFVVRYERVKLPA